MFFGRKVLSAANFGRAASGVRSVGRVVKEKGEIIRNDLLLDTTIPQRV